MDYALITCPPYCRVNCSVRHHPLLVVLLNCGDTDDMGVLKQRLHDLKHIVTRYEQTGWHKDENIPDAVEHYRFPMIHWACALGRAAAVEWLVHHGMDPTVRTSQDEQEETGLHRAIICLQETCPVSASDKLRLLVSPLAPALAVEDGAGNTPLHACCAHLTNETPRHEFYHDAVTAILAHLKNTNKALLHELIHSTNTEGNTPLHILCRNDRCFTTVKEMIDAGTGIDNKNHRGQSPLDVALEKGQVRLVKYLYDEVNPNAAAFASSTGGDVSAGGEKSVRTQHNKRQPKLATRKLYDNKGIIIGEEVKVDIKNRHARKRQGSECESVCSKRSLLSPERSLSRSRTPDSIAAATAPSSPSNRDDDNDNTDTTENKGCEKSKCIKKKTPEEIEAEELASLPDLETANEINARSDEDFLKFLFTLPNGVRKKVTSVLFEQHKQCLLQMSHLGFMEEQLSVKQDQLQVRQKFIVQQIQDLLLKLAKIQKEENEISEEINLIKKDIEHTKTGREELEDKMQRLQDGIKIFFAEELKEEVENIDIDKDQIPGNTKDEPPDKKVNKDIDSSCQLNPLNVSKSTDASKPQTTLVKDNESDHESDKNSSKQHIEDNEEELTEGEDSDIDSDSSFDVDDEEEFKNFVKEFFESDDEEEPFVFEDNDQQPCWDLCLKHCACAKIQDGVKKENASEDTANSVSKDTATLMDKVLVKDLDNDSVPFVSKHARDGSKQGAVELANTDICRLSDNHLIESKAAAVKEFSAGKKIVDGYTSMDTNLTKSNGNSGIPMELKDKCVNQTTTDILRKSSDKERMQNVPNHCMYKEESKVSKESCHLKNNGRNNVRKPKSSKSSPKASTAVNKASTAVNKASTAVNKANTAVNKASTAVNKASTAVNNKLVPTNTANTGKSYRMYLERCAHSKGLKNGTLNNMSSFCPDKDFPIHNNICGKSTNKNCTIVRPPNQMDKHVNNSDDICSSLKSKNCTLSGLGKNKNYSAIGNPKNFTVSSPNAKNFTVSSPNAKNFTVSSPNAKNFTVNSPNAKNFTVSSPNAKNFTVTSPNAKNFTVSSPNAKNFTVSSPNAKNFTVSSPNAKNCTVTSPNAKNCTISSPMDLRCSEKDASSIGLDNCSKLVSGSVKKRPRQRDRKKGINAKYTESVNKCEKQSEQNGGFEQFIRERAKPKAQTKKRKAYVVQKFTVDDDKSSVSPDKDKKGLILPYYDGNTIDDNDIEPFEELV